MSRVRAVWRAVGGVVAVGLVLGGCTGGDPDPVTTTSEPVVDSPEPSPTPTRDLTKLPERPAAMDEPTTDGAIAAATYVLDLYTYAFVTGDAGPWRSIVSASCEFCRGVAEAAEGMASEGHASTGAPFTVLESKSVEQTAAEWFTVDLVVEQAASSRVDADGAVVATNPGGTFRVVYALSWDDRWRVDEMGFERIDASGGSDG